MKYYLQFLLLALLVPSLAFSAYITPYNFYNRTYNRRRDYIERQYYKFPRGFHSDYTILDYNHPSANVLKTQHHYMKDVQQLPPYNTSLVPIASKEQLRFLYNRLKGEWKLVPNRTDNVIAFEEIQYLKINDCNEGFLSEIDSKFKEVENLANFECLIQMNVYQHKPMLSKERIDLTKVATQYVLMNFNTNILIEYIYDQNQIFVYYYDFISFDDYLDLSINHFATLNVSDKIYAETSPAFLERVKRITPLVLVHYPEVASQYLSEQHRNVSNKASTARGGGFQ